MALSYAEKRSAIAHVGEELAQRGWQLFGYFEDQSDAMTDYFAPASWDGVATHPDYPGVVVGVGVSAYRADKHSGQDEVRMRQVPGAECPRCAGSGVDPLGWTLEAARQDPERYHRERIQATHGPNSGARALLNVVSPIPFGDGGQLHCVKCSGRGHALIQERYVRCTWPEFQATPKGRMWHVERGGRIVKSGTGYTRCRGSRYNAEAKQAMQTVCDAIESAARTASTSKVAPPVPEATTDAGAFTVTHDRDWTWVKFPIKPEAGVLTAVKGLGARWSKKRRAWYIRRHVALTEVQMVLRGLC